MKTRSIVMAIALMVIATASLVAQTPSPSFEILNQQGSSVYKLSYKNPGKNRVLLRISDRFGVLYTKPILVTNGFTYPLDFKGMAKGEYKVEISGKKSLLKESITYDPSTPQAYVHVSKTPNDKYLLTIKSQAPSDFTVRIFDRWNNEVHQSRESVAKEFGLVYNLTNVNGPFSFEVVNNTGNVEVVQR